MHRDSGVFACHTANRVGGPGLAGRASMRPMANLLADNPLLVLFICLAIGSAAGSIRVGGLTLGPAAVLFAALALSAWDERLALPGEVGSLGLAIFAYCIGVASGPAFFGSLRHNVPIATGVVIIVAGSAVAAALIGSALGLSRAVSAGVFAGGLTNTPALAAASERIGEAAGPTVGYSVTYLGGVIVMLGLAAWALRRPTDDAEVAETPPLVAKTLKVTRDGLPTLGDLAVAADRPVVFSRIKHGEHIEVPRDDMTVHAGDLVAAVGRADDVARISDMVGGVADESLTLDRRSLDMRRIALSKRRLSGRTVAELGLERFGARATRVRRGDVDLMALPDMLVHQGDRIRVIAPRDRLSEVARHLGDSERGPGDLNPIGLSIGLAVGVLIGLIPIPAPGGSISMGAAAGPLIAGLVLGRVARSGPIVWSLPYTASQLLQQLGILIFLAVAGSRAGGGFVDALSGDQGIRILVAGLCVTVLFAAALLVLARLVKMDGPPLAGMIAGAQTQPAVLAFAKERTGGSHRVELAYAVIVPAAMIAKIVAATLLVGVG